MAGETILLALDTSQLWHRFVIVRVALVYRGRALPLSWAVLTSKSATVALERYRSLLEQVAVLLPSSSRVILLADRGFMDVKLMQLARDLGWHFRIRAKLSVWVYHATKMRLKIKALFPSPAGARFFRNVWLTEQRFGPVHLAVVYVGTQNGYERWPIISDEPTSPETLNEYGRRFCIEIVFTQMTKTGYFPLGRSRYDLADFHSVIINNTVNEQFNQLPAPGETQRLQSRLDALTKRLNVLAQFERINMFLSLHLQLTQLLF